MLFFFSRGGGRARLNCSFLWLLAFVAVNGNALATIEHFGNIVATNRFDQTSSAQWSPLRFSAYGPAPGYQSPTLSANIAFASAFGWSGKRVDETGLIYFGARYYDPTEKRFLSYDPLGPAATPGGYAAFSGDPIYWADPDGRWALEKYSNEAAYWNAMADPERRTQAFVEEKFGSLHGGFNWAVEQAQAINGMVNQQLPFASYLNDAAVNYISETGNNWINSAADAANVDLNSPSARSGDFRSRFGLTLGSLFLGAGEVKIATEFEQIAAREGQQIFRVVNDAELQVIQQSGKFEFPPWGSTPTGQPGKFFWGNTDEAAKFQQMWYRGGESSHIVTTTIGPEVKPMPFPHGDGIGTSLFVDLKDLTAPIKVVPKP